MFSLIISFGIRERARRAARRRDEPVDALSGDHFNSTPKRPVPLSTCDGRSSRRAAHARENLTYPTLFGEALLLLEIAEFRVERVDRVEWASPH